MALEVRRLVEEDLEKLGFGSLRSDLRFFELIKRRRIERRSLWPKSIEDLRPELGKFIRIALDPGKVWVFFGQTLGPKEIIFSPAVEMLSQAKIRGWHYFVASGSDAESLEPAIEMWGSGGIGEMVILVVEKSRLKEAGRLLTERDVASAVDLGDVCLISQGDPDAGLIGLKSQDQEAWLQRLHTN